MSVREVLRRLRNEAELWGKIDTKPFEDELQSLILGAVGKEKEIDLSKTDFVSCNSDALYGYNQAIKETKSNLAKLFEKEE